MKIFIQNNKLSIFFVSILAFVIYLQSLDFGYVLDDVMVIEKNQFTQRGIDGIVNIFKYESFRGYYGEQNQLLEGDRYRPLSIATFALEKSLFGQNPLVSHLINVLLYSLTGVFLFRILWFFFPNQGENQKWYMSIPFLTTTFFIAHPLHIEVVANIKGRDEIFAFLGEMGILYCTFKYLNEKNVKYLIASFAITFLSVLSKENVITFLAIVPLTAYFFTKSTYKENLLVSLPVFLGVVVYLGLRINAIGYLLDNKVITDVMNNPFYGMTFLEKTATIFYTFLVYFKLHLFPYPLTHDYYPYQIPKVNWSAWQPMLSLVLNLILGVIILRGWRKKSIWAYCALYYFITLSIVSNLFVSVGTFMNERFVYHASLGFCMAMAYFFHTWIRRINLPLQMIFVVLPFLMLVFYGIIDFIRIPAWKNNETLDKTDIQFSPNSARANCFYGVRLWEDFQKNYSNLSNEAKITQLQDMKYYFDKSVSILPSYKAAHKMRAGVAVEYHKLNNDYDAMIAVFEEVSRLGTYPQFATDYLEILNPKVDTKAHADKLLAFYERMIVYYTENFPEKRVHMQYEGFKEDLHESMKILK